MSVNSKTNTKHINWMFLLPKKNWLYGISKPITNWNAANKYHKRLPRLAVQLLRACNNDQLIST